MKNAKIAKSSGMQISTTKTRTENGIEIDMCSISRNEIQLDAQLAFGLDIFEKRSQLEQR
ncbi:MAG: hypothetical protein QNJ51_21380 [Calothrix sp. MO_167.B12]|nr:hypothetical protein [Calothrix sp. MO_167.B12]